MGKEKHIWIKECPRCRAVLATLDITCWPPCPLCGWPVSEADDRGQDQMRRKEHEAIAKQPQGILPPQ